jgi:hypothetical protein
MIFLYKLYAKLNGNRKTFDSRESLKKEMSIYGKQLTSLELSLQDNDLHYEFSMLSAFHYILTGEIPGKYKKESDKK